MCSTKDHELEYYYSILKSYYDIEGSMEWLTGERDINFKVMSSSGDSFVLKISGINEKAEETALQIDVLEYLKNKDLSVSIPRVVKGLDGKNSRVIKDLNGSNRTMRLVTFVGGDILSGQVKSEEIFLSCGEIVSSLQVALQEYKNIHAFRYCQWDLKHTYSLLDLLPGVSDKYVYGELKHVINRFRSEVMPYWENLGKQIVHNDLHPGNLLTSSQNLGNICGVIDFGDVVYTSTCADLAVACAGQVVEYNNAPEALIAICNSYKRKKAISDLELKMLPLLVSSRLAAAILIPQWHNMNNPHSNHFSHVGEEFTSHQISNIESLFLNEKYIFEALKS